MCPDIEWYNDTGFVKNCCDKHDLCEYLKCDLDPRVNWNNAESLGNFVIHRTKSALDGNYAPHRSHQVFFGVLVVFLHFFPDDLDGPRYLFDHVCKTTVFFIIFVVCVHSCIYFQTVVFGSALIAYFFRFKVQEIQ